MFKLGHAYGPPHEVDYVDGMWLHFHQSYGMTSILMGRKRFPKFLQFLRAMLSRTKDQMDGELNFGDLRFLCEGPDEGHFNIFVDSGDSTRFMFGIEKHEIEPFINALSMQFLDAYQKDNSNE